MAAITGRNGTITIGDGPPSAVKSMVTMRNQNADLNTSPDAKRRMASAAARLLEKNGLIHQGMDVRETDAAAVAIADNTGCSEYVARTAIYRALRIDGRPDSPADAHQVFTGDGVDEPLGIVVPVMRQTVQLTWPASAVEAARNFGIAMNNAAAIIQRSAMPSVVVGAPTKPNQPQSFERPKRRIRLG